MEVCDEREVSNKTMSPVEASVLLFHCFTIVFGNELLPRAMRPGKGHFQYGEIIIRKLVNSGI